MNKKPLILFGLLLLMAAIFHFLPMVEAGRMTVPEHLYANRSCDCFCLMDLRAWYSRTNYWFWLWIIGVPLIVFFFQPNSPSWQRSLRTLFAIGFCYPVMVLAMFLSWDIRNDLFMVQQNLPDQKTWDMGCANIADGASVAFTLFFGWLYASVYTGWWEIIWHVYHKYFSRKVDVNFRRDLFSKIIFCITIPLSVAVIPFFLFILYIKISS